MVTDEAEEGQQAPEYIVDEEDRRFVKSMFDDAAGLEEAEGPITEEMVKGLELKYEAFL